MMLAVLSFSVFAEDEAVTADNGGVILVGSTGTKQDDEQVLVDSAEPGALELKETEKLESGIDGEGVTPVDGLVGATNDAVVADKAADEGSMGGSDDAGDDKTADNENKKPSVWGNVLSLGIPILILVAFFYFGMYRPQKKQEKEKKEMMDNLQVGAEIMTIGGIMGKIVTVRESSVVIESGSDKNKLEISKQAISSVK